MPVSAAPRGGAPRILVSPASLHKGAVWVPLPLSWSASADDPVPTDRGEVSSNLGVWQTIRMIGTSLSLGVIDGTAQRQAIHRGPAREPAGGACRRPARRSPHGRSGVSAPRAIDRRALRAADAARAPRG